MMPSTSTAVAISAFIFWVCGRRTWLFFVSVEIGQMSGMDSSTKSVR